MNQSTLRLLPVFTISVSLLFSAPLAQEKPLVCVLPLSAVSIKTEDAQLFTEAIQRKLEGNSKFALISQGVIRDSIEKVFGTADGRCNSDECLIDFGKRLKADYMLSGSLGQIGALYTLNIKFIEVQNEKIALTKEYQGKTNIEYFYQKSPERVVADLAGLCFPGSVSASSEPAADAPETYQAPRQTNTAAEPFKPEADKWTPSDSNYGLVQAPSIGVSGNITFIDPTEEQSLYGVQLMYVHPTGAKSQVRIIAGFPMAESKSEVKSRTWRAPDPQVSIEEEWGMPYFGISIGLSYMYMHAFQQIDSGYINYGYSTVYTANFPAVQTYNYVFGIRGGRPNAGFKGRISWPTPWSISTNKPANYMFEYSAMGVFGTRTFKGGIGIAGMYKQREASRPAGSFNYYYEDYLRISQFQRMFPCGRVAFMAGQQTVIGISADFFGLLFPRDSQSSWWGAPSIGVQCLFSFAPLHGANLVDGTF